MGDVREKANKAKEANTQRFDFVQRDAGRWAKSAENDVVLTIVCAHTPKIQIIIKQF